MRIQPEALELLKDLNLLFEEDGYLSLDVDLIEFLERTLNISEIVSTGRIVELSNDSQNLYSIYDGLESDEDRRSAARKIRKLTETIVADFRTTQKDIRRLINQEFRFETSLTLKLQQLETYQKKSEEFVNTLELCQRRFDDTETWIAASHPNLRAPRKRLQKQLRIARQSAAAIASDILDYIHRAREDKDYLNKLARICDLIDRQEYESQSNLNEVLLQGNLSRLSRTEPIRTLLASDLDGDEQLISRLNERAEKLGLAQEEQDAPVLVQNEDTSQTIHIPDIRSIIATFERTHRNRDLFTFLFEEPINFPADDMLEQRLLETFCLILTTESSMRFFVKDHMGEYLGKDKRYHYMIVYAEPISNSRPRHEIQSQPLISI